MSVILTNNFIIDNEILILNEKLDHIKSVRDRFPYYKKVTGFYSREIEVRQQTRVESLELSKLKHLQNSIMYNEKKMTSQILNSRGD